MKATQNLIFPHEAARILGRTPAAVRALGERGRLKVVRIGRVHFFDRREVEGLAEERRAKAAGADDAGARR